MFKITECTTLEFTAAKWTLEKRSGIYKTNRGDLQHKSLFIKLTVVVCEAKVYL